jgi:hypothetical protein
VPSNKKGWGSEKVSELVPESHRRMKRLVQGSMACVVKVAGGGGAECAREGLRVCLVCHGGLKTVSNRLWILLPCFERACSCIRSHLVGHVRRPRSHADAEEGSSCPQAPFTKKVTLQSQSCLKNNDSEKQKQQYLHRNRPTRWSHQCHHHECPNKAQSLSTIVLGIDAGLPDL